MQLSESDSWTPEQKKWVVIGAVGAAIIVCVALIFGYQLYQRGKPKEGVEQVQELGFGFRCVTIAKFNKGELERYPFFSYRDRLLCQISGAPPSISPSGNFAIYQDPRSGKLMLFRRSDERTTPLTLTGVAVTSAFKWHEDQGTVEVELGTDHLSSEFPLQ